MVGDRGLPGLPGFRGDYSFSGPQGETGVTGKQISFDYILFVHLCDAYNKILFL